MNPGDDIYEEIDRIRYWDKVLLCCSETSLTSWWVDNEIGTALNKEQQVTRDRGQTISAIIPLDLDGFIFSEDFRKGYKAQLTRRLAADFQGWRHKFQAALQQVIKALRTDGGKEPPPEQKL